MALTIAALFTSRKIGGIMKLFIFTTLFAAQVFANPFDAFTGKYIVQGKVQVKNVNTKGCIRYDIPNLVEVEVSKNTDGYKQSHIISLKNPSGVSNLPVMDYKSFPDYLNPSIYYSAQTSGGANYAMNVENSNAKKHYSDKFALERQSDKVVFTFAEETIEDGNVISGCYYVAILK